MLIDITTKQTIILRALISKAVKDYGRDPDIDDLAYRLAAADEAFRLSRIEHHDDTASRCAECGHFTAHYPTCTEYPDDDVSGMDEGGDL